MTGMRCADCGRPILASDTRCFHCGAAIAGREADAAAEDDAEGFDLRTTVRLGLVVLALMIAGLILAHWMGQAVAPGNLGALGY
jgi:hypothetical protein